MGSAAAAPASQNRVANNSAGTQTDRVELCRPRIAETRCRCMPDTHATVESENLKPAFGLGAVSATLRVERARRVSHEVVTRITTATQELVRTPSVGGVDAPNAICQLVSRQLCEAGLKPELLCGADGQPVAVVAEIVGAHPGPTYALDAVVDTAPLGDRKRWNRQDPVSGHIENGRLYGRGAADSKVAAAIFVEIGRNLTKHAARMHGKTILFFDAAEHTGDFAGVKAFVERFPKVDGVMIGYPGDHSLYVGSRGFNRQRVSASLKQPGDPDAVADVLLSIAHRALPVERNDDFPLRPKLTLTAIHSQRVNDDTRAVRSYDVEIAGKACHSGATRDSGVNAITKTATFLRKLTADIQGRLGLEAKPMVQALEGGASFSQIPDLVQLRLAFPATVDRKVVEKSIGRQLMLVDEQQRHGRGSRFFPSKQAVGAKLSGFQLNVDIRTTPLFGEGWARAHMKASLERIGGQAVVTSEEVQSEPPYVLDRDAPLRLAMEAAVTNDGQRDIPSRVCGPSNVGNLLQKHGIAATAGYGVAFRGMHATNESISLRSIPSTYAVYRRAVRLLMGLERATS